MALRVAKRRTPTSRHSMPQWSERVRRVRMAHSFFIHSTGAGPFLWDGVPDDITVGTEVHKPANVGYPPNEIVERGTKVTAFDDVEHLFKLVPADGDVHLYAHSYG